MGYRMDIVKFKSKIFHVTRILDELVDRLLMNLVLDALIELYRRS